MEALLGNIDILVEWVQVNGWFVFLAQYVFSCFTQALVQPTVGAPRWYVFTYRFAHLLAGNVNVVRKPVQ